LHHSPPGTTLVKEHERTDKKKTNHRGRSPFPESLPRETTVIYPEGFDENSPGQVIGSCKINGINPQEWLEHILFTISDTKLTNLASLLPNAWQKPE